MQVVALEASKIIFVFPVFNEALSIPRLGQDLSTFETMIKQITPGQNIRVEFLFIDDGSTDGTHEHLEKLGKDNVKVVRHAHNQGPGAAFQTAFSTIIAGNIAPLDLVITLEGDATSDPQMLIKMLRRIEEGYEIVLASPYLYGGGFLGVQTHRIFLSHMANFLFKLVFGIRGIATFSCFYRVYRGATLQKLNAAYDGKIVSCAGFECAAEIIMKATRCKLSIAEVPLVVDWSKKKGKSKMKVFKTSWGYLTMFVKLFSVKPQV